MAAPDVAPGAPVPPDMPPAPSPVPALNRFADECSAIEPPPADGDMHGYAAQCFSNLLELLRVGLMPAGLTPQQVGAELDAAELAVNRLGLRRGDGLGTPAARAVTAADATSDLLSSLVSATEAGDPAAVEAVRTAAAELNDEAPLSAQGDRLAAYFAAADHALRPVVRALSS